MLACDVFMYFPVTLNRLEKAPVKIIQNQHYILLEIKSSAKTTGPTGAQNLTSVMHMKINTVNTHYKVLHYKVLPDIQESAFSFDCPK